MTDSLPVSVVIPTIGRQAQLRRCLESIARCEPRAAEVVVVDQSGAPAMEELVNAFAPIGARLVRCHGRGVGLARNTCLREATHDIVAMTDDDCTVAPTWVATAHRMASSDPGRIFTGRVLAGTDDPGIHIPATRTDEVPRDFTGERACDGLFSGNVVLPRRQALELGGFDERLETAEDNDFGYRWLSAGNAMTFDPELVVWHHDWRTQEELEQLYVVYWRGQGGFYGKHLRRGDTRMLYFLARDIKKALQATMERLLRGRPRWTDWRRGIMRGLPPGLVRGLLGRGSR